MLRKIRRTLAVLFFACITLLFLDFTGTLHAWLGWMARVQFLPAVLALNVGVVAALAVLTLLFGRVYCSVVCPLGVFQDLVAWLGGRGKRRKYRFSYSPARRWLRCGTLALFVAALVAGVGSLVALLAPYSPTDVSPPTSSVRFISGATMRWPRSPSVWEAMRSMKRRSGWRACRRC